MDDSDRLLLLAMAVLAIKHCIADFFLQTPYQFRNKGRYGHPGGLLHATLHILCTLPVFAVLVPANWQAAAVILAGEFLVHYHVDWTKENVMKLGKWTPAQNWFWRMLGLDQLAHGLTYVAMLWVMASPGLADGIAADLSTWVRGFLR